MSLAFTPYDQKDSTYLLTVRLFDPVLEFLKVVDTVVRHANRADLARLDALDERFPRPNPTVQDKQLPWTHILLFV